MKIKRSDFFLFFKKKQQKTKPKQRQKCHTPLLIQRRHHNTRSPRKPHRQRRLIPQRPSRRVPHPVQLIIRQFHIIHPQHFRQNHAHLNHRQTIHQVSHVKRRWGCWGDLLATETDARAQQEGLTGVLLVRAFFIDPSLRDELVGLVEIGFGMGCGPGAGEDLDLWLTVSNMWRGSYGEGVRTPSGIYMPSTVSPGLKRPIPIGTGGYIRSPSSMTA
jgi:hypothetical protein